MKSHEIAKALQVLAKVLRSGPDVELNALNLNERTLSSEDMRANAPAALAMLAALARFNKSEWAALIEEYNLGVTVKKTDSTRDLLGRLLSHLNENETVRQRLTDAARKPRANVSPELMSALSILLRR
jgi:hypothetical protein